MFNLIICECLRWSSPFKNKEAFDFHKMQKIGNAVVSIILYILEFMFSMFDAEISNIKLTNDRKIRK